MSPSRKRHWFVKQYSVDSVLYKWFNKKRAHNIPIRGPVLLQNAVNFATKLKDSNFKANAGWRFKSRHGIVCRSVCAEGGAIDSDWKHDWKKTINSQNWSHVMMHFHRNRINLNLFVCFCFWSYYYFDIK